MKGKKIFTSEEVFKIKELIRQKLQSSNNEQKGIRDKIRRIGFYWEENKKKTEIPKVEYNIENFEELIRNRNITIQN